MTHDPRCPGCGHVNDANATHCEQCNYPLRERTPEPAPPAVEPAEAPVEISRERIRPIRPRRPSSPQQQMQLQLWLVLGGLAIVAVLYTAYMGFRRSNAVPVQVPGAQPEQLKAAELAQAEIARDSTNVNAQIALANVLFDTANWPEAIIHYKSALRLDSTRVTTMVDLGVCYYNLAQTEDAEALFRRALALDPNQPVALFNLGIVAENREQYDQALEYYHRARQAGAPANMAQALEQAIQRIAQKRGR